MPFTRSNGYRYAGEADSRSPRYNRVLIERIIVVSLAHGVIARVIGWVVVKVRFPRRKRAVIAAVGADSFGDGCYGLGPRGGRVLTTVPRTSGVIASRRSTVSALFLILPCSRLWICVSQSM